MGVQFWLASTDTSLRVRFGAGFHIRPPKEQSMGDAKRRGGRASIESPPMSATCGRVRRRSRGQAMKGPVAKAPRPSRICPMSMPPTSGDPGAAAVTAERPGWLAPIEWAAMAAASALWMTLALRLAATESASSRWGWVVVGVALGYLAADFFSGIVHWFCDTFFEETTPLIGRMLIEPFREHHRDALAMTRHGLAEIAGNSCLAVAPLLGAVAFLAPPATGAPLSLAAHAALL